MSVSLVSALQLLLHAVHVSAVRPAMTGYAVTTNSTSSLPAAPFVFSVHFVNDVSDR